MSGRPEVLFPLYAPLNGMKGIGPRTAQHLEQLDIRLPRDLLFSLPRSALVRRRISTIAEGRTQESVAVEVTVVSHKPGARKGLPHRVWVDDGQNRFHLVFFQAQRDWIEKSLPAGQRRLVCGKVDEFNGYRQIVHPDQILEPDKTEVIPLVEPVYPLVSGLTPEDHEEVRCDGARTRPRSSRMDRSGDALHAAVAKLARCALTLPFAAIGVGHGT